MHASENTMRYTIQKISATETWAIRHQVMWPDRPLDYVRLPNDDEGAHYGLFVEGKLISVISLFIKNGAAQFRKFATLKEAQGKGYGSILLKEIIQISAQEQVQKLWCNARVDKTQYYLKFGLHVTDQTFDKGGVAFVIMEREF